MFSSYFDAILQVPAQVPGHLPPADWLLHPYEPLEGIRSQAHLPQPHHLRLPLLPPLLPLQIRLPQHQISGSAFAASPAKVLRDFNYILYFASMLENQKLQHRS